MSLITNIVDIITTRQVASEERGVGIQTADQDVEATKVFEDVDFFNSRAKGSDVYASGDQLAQNKAYGVVATVYKCVSVIAQNIAQLSLKVYDYRDPNNPEELKDRPEFDIFKRYNDIQTSYDFWEAVFTYLELTGEAPLLKRYKGNKLVELFPFTPEVLTVIPKNDFVIDGYHLHLGGKQITAESSDVIFFKYFNPNNPLRGISPLQAATRDVTLDLSAQTSSKNIFTNGARPSGFLSSEQQMNDGVFKRAVKMIKDSMEGSKNHGKIGVVSHGFKFHPITITAKDSELIKQRTFTKQTIREAFGVPPIYTMDFSDAGVLANADVQEGLLWKSTLIPRITKVEQMINEFLMPDITTNPNIRVAFDLSQIAALQSDISAKHDRYMDGVQQGILTRNEVRTDIYKLEAAEAPGMDEHIIPGYRTPQASDAINEIEERLERIFPTEVRDISDVMTKIKQADSAAEVEQIKADTVRAVLKKADEIADDFKGKLLILFNEQKEDVLKKIDNMKDYKRPKHKSRKQFSNEMTGMVFDVDYWMQRFQQEGKPYLAEAIYQGMQQWETQFGGIIDVTAPGIDGYVNQQSVRYAKIVNETTQKEIDTLIGKGLLEGRTISEIGGMLGTYFDEAEQYRADRISRTEMVRASNRGRFEANKQHSEYENHMWITSRDQDVRDSHSAAEGQIVKVGDAFIVDDSTMADSRYPSAINERCTTMPTKEKVNV